MNAYAKQRMTDPGKPKMAKTEAEARRIQAENQRRLDQLKKGKK